MINPVLTHADESKAELKRAYIEEAMGMTPAQAGFRYIKSGYKGTHDFLNIWPIGDLHIGSPHFDPKHVGAVLAGVDENRENSRILIMGDVIENANKASVGAGVYEQVDNPISQVERAAAIFEPYKDLIDGVVTGNHELRSYKSEQIDLLYLFCKFLGIEDKYLGYSGIVGYAWNKRAYGVYMWHGAGGGAKPGSSLNKIEDQTKVAENCDVFLMGHVHRKMAYKKDINRPDHRNGRMVTHEQLFVITGSSLNWAGSYAQMVGLAPSTAGYPRIVLGGRTVGGKRLKETYASI
jgi:hypothetical protein